MYRLKFEPQFTNDYKVLKKKHPELMKDLRQALNELRDMGMVTISYNPHVLDNRGGNYNGYFEFHLSDGFIDVLVLYLPHKSNPIIRLVRIGTHLELFQGEVK